MSLYTRTFSFQDGSPADGGQVRSELDRLGTAFNTNTNLLGYAYATSDAQTITTGGTDITNCSVTVTVPAGGRAIKITGSVFIYSGTANQGAYMAIKEGSTTLNQGGLVLSKANGSERVVVMHVFVPTVGSHTYKLTANMETANGNTSTASGYYGFILVELI